MLNRSSGLFALSNGEGDMQALLKRCDSKDATAQLAVDGFTVSIRKTIGSYAALLGGIDLLVFTGGIGEHSQAVRRAVCEQLEFLGLSLKSGENAKVRVLAAEEEKQIARHCRALMVGSS